MVLQLKDRNRKNQSKSRKLGVAGKQGFEPRFHDPESCVLPLDDFPVKAMIIDIAEFFNNSGDIGSFSVIRNHYSTVIASEAW